MPGVADGTRNFSWLADRELLLLGGKPLDAALARLSAGGIAAAWRPAASCWRCRLRRWPT